MSAVYYCNHYPSDYIRLANEDHTDLINIATCEHEYGGARVAEVELTLEDAEGFANHILALVERMKK